MEIKTDKKKNVVEPSLTFTTQRNIPICCSDLVIVHGFYGCG